MTTQNPFAVVANDAKAAVAAIVSGLKWFGAEAAKAIGWVDATIPGAQQALAGLFQAADTAATTLETHASAGFADIVSGAIDEAGTTIANLLSASGLDLATKQTLSAADVATVTAAQSIAQSAISVATANLLGATAQVASAANAANAASPAASPQAAAARAQ
ncbi:MAG TPA: hypothetical protein VME40_03735 [Caulobacteraceae bacterium]|nr:hypothetical protein [Caulobacteraceae bacterium]